MITKTYRRTTQTRVSECQNPEQVEARQLDAATKWMQAEAWWPKNLVLIDTGGIQSLAEKTNEILVDERWHSWCLLGVGHVPPQVARAIIVDAFSRHIGRLGKEP